MAQQIFVDGKARVPSSLVAGCKKRATQPSAKRSSQTAKFISEQCLSMLPYTDTKPKGATDFYFTVNWSQGGTVIDAFRKSVKP